MSSGLPTSSAAVSVVIPVYNGAAYIEDAISSVLSQGEVVREVIVLDNASTDGTGDRVVRNRDPRLRLERQSTLVPAWRNWTDACRLASGQFIKLVCADDRILLGALEAQTEVLIANPTAAAVSARRRVITHRGRVLVVANGMETGGVVPWSDVLRKTLLSGANLVGEPACLLFRREVLQEALPWSESWSYLIDLDLYSRAFFGRDIVGLPEVHADFRLARRSWSDSLRDTQADEFVAFAEDCVRRGAAAISDIEITKVREAAERRQRTRHKAYRVASLLDRVPEFLLPNRFVG